MVFTALEKQKEIEREVKMREQVFARVVRNGGMSKNEAARRIAIMQAIADDYTKLAESERLL